MSENKKKKYTKEERKKLLNEVANNILEKACSEKISLVALYDTADEMSSDIRHAIRTGAHAKVRRLSKRRNKR